MQRLDVIAFQSNKASFIEKMNDDVIFTFSGGATQHSVNTKDRVRISQ
jgi:hypothetical protein